MNISELTFGQALLGVYLSQLNWAEKDFIREFSIEDEYLLSILLDQVRPTITDLVGLEEALCLDEGSLIDLWLATCQNHPRIRGEY